MAEVKKYREIEIIRERNRVRTHAFNIHHSKGAVYGFLQEAILASEKCLLNFRDIESPLRAIASMREVLDIYRSLQDRVGRDLGMSFVMDDLHRVGTLLKRCCMYTIKDNDNRTVQILDELMHINDRLLYVANNEDRVDESGFI